MVIFRHFQPFNFILFKPLILILTRAHASHTRCSSYGTHTGHQRVNDLHIFSFTSNKWSVLSNTGAPSPRDRHIAAVYENELFIFGGFDGHARVNDMHAFNLETNIWRIVNPPADNFPPSPRHSHTAVVYKESLYCFGGYDGR